MYYFTQIALLNSELCAFLCVLIAPFIFPSLALIVLGNKCLFACMYKSALS